MSFTPPTPPDHNRAKANLVIAGEHRRQRASSFQDIDAAVALIRRAITWPVRILRRHNNDDPRGL